MLWQICNNSDVTGTKGTAVLIRNAVIVFVGTLDVFPAEINDVRQLQRGNSLIAQEAE